MECFKNSVSEKEMHYTNTNWTHFSYGFHNLDYVWWNAPASLECMYPAQQSIVEHNRVVYEVTSSIHAVHARLNPYNISCSIE